MEAWTEERIARVRDGVNDGLTNPQIAKLLGVSSGAIASIRHRVRRYAVEWTPERIDSLRAMVTEGLSNVEIGRRLGVPVEQVIGFRRRNNMQLDPIPTLPPWTPEQDAVLLGLIEKGASKAEIIETCGRSDRAIKARIRRLRDRGDLPERVSAEQQKPAEYGEPINLGNDDEKHLRLIAKANGGRGFPFYDLPATYRVAA